MLQGGPPAQGRAQSEKSLLWRGPQDETSALDVPEAITQGDTREEAMENGLDAFLTAMDFYVEDVRPLNPPSAIAPGAVCDCSS